MQRIKIFTSASFGDDLGQLEAAIGMWLSDAPRYIHFVAQSPHGEHLVVTLIYADDDTVSERATSGAVAVPEVFEHTLEDTTLDPERPDQRSLPELELPY